MSMYPFIEAEKVGQRSVKRTCAVLKVSRAAYYKWRQQEPSARVLEDQGLTEKVKVIFAGSRQTYGTPRVHRELRQEGTRCSRKRVARLMREQNLQGRRRRAWRRTTVPDPDTKVTAVDLVGRRFEVGSMGLNRCWAGDITYVRTWEGWLYLATVIDLASRRVVGWAMADHMRADLVCEALQMAILSRQPEAGLIFHSDRGSQYTSALFTELLGKHGIRQSLSRPRQCWDNAVAEAWYSTLKVELVHRHAWVTRSAARQAIFEFIEVFYNRRRLHSALGYAAPAVYEGCLATTPGRVPQGGMEAA
jgi:transposase InsO family protein